MQRARVFNLDREDLMEKVTEPWLESRTIQMGDREWEPRHSSLRILEGPQMQTTDLSFGQGWANAERAGEDVTRAILAQAPPSSAPDAFVIEAQDPERLAARLAADHDGRAVEWGEAKRRLDGRNPQVAAVILVLKSMTNPA